MANPSSIATAVANKSLSQPVTMELPPLIGGLVQHMLVSPSTQVRILVIVDETGSASVGDVIVALPDHPDPVGAIAVMLNLGILVAEIRDGVLDANTIIRRAPLEPGPAGSSATSPGPTRPQGSGPVMASSDDGRSLTQLDLGSLAPRLIIGPGTRRCEFASDPVLRRPGVYGLLSATRAYIGLGSDAGRRVARGQQPIEDIEIIFVITDANGNLSTEDAAAYERILWSRAMAFGDRPVVNGVPDGAPVNVERYAELDLFIGQACLALAQMGLMFTRSSPRTLLAGPRSEPGRIGALRPFNGIPEGEVFELEFGNGLVALASRQPDGTWLLLRGSEVRVDTVASATASTGFLRSAWVHAGLLQVSPDGRGLLVKRDLVFSTGSAAAHFCTGSKGRGRGGWRPIDPEGGYDPATPALIAG